MKISKLFYLMLIGLAVYSCSDDDDADLDGNTPPEVIDNFFPLVVGNAWDYENVLSSPDQDNQVSFETLSTVSSSEGNFDFETDNPMNAGPVTSALSQGVLSKNNNQLIFSGSLGFGVEGFPDFQIGLDNAPMYDLNATAGSVMFNDSGNFQEMIEGVPVTLNYDIETVMGNSLTSYQVNGNTFDDVISSKIIITLEIKASLFLEVTILPEQQVVEIENYFAKDVGIIFSDTDVDFDFIELGQLPFPLEDLEFDVTQSLESYNVELD